MRFAPGVDLHVRIWEGDPRRQDYFKREWPKEFKLYEGPDQFVGPTLNRFFNEHRFEDSYGFIGDDVLLATPEGLQHLEALAYPFFLAYPNDTIQRHAKTTHFCVGGELVRRLGWVIPPGINQMHIDDAIGAVAASFNLVRYAPQVIFYHAHPMAGRAEDDETYRVAYSDTKKGIFDTELGRADKRSLREFVSQMGDYVNSKVAPMLLEVEVIQLQDAGYEEIPVHNSSPEPVQTAGLDSGGVGGRDSARGIQEPGRDSGGIPGSGPADGSAAALFDKDPEKGSGQVSGRSVWVATKREYKYPDANVVVCVPSTGQWQARTASSIALNIADFIQNGPLPGMRSAQVHLHTLESSMLSKNREDAVKTMMQRGQTHILFVDSDMILPQNALRRLLSHDLPFVAANCTTREFPPQPTAIDFTGAKVSSLGKTGLERVRQVGLAVALIRRDVFMQSEPPHFLMDWIPGAQSYCGEDIYFSQILSDLGIDVMIDHDLSNEVGHVGWTIFGHGQVGCAPPPNWRVE